MVFFTCFTLRPFTLNLEDSIEEVISQLSKRRRALRCAAAESRANAAAPQCLKRLTRPRSDIFEVGGYEWKLEMYPYGDSQVVPSPRTGQIRPLLSATPP